MDENKSDKAIVLFDGVCNFCNASVNFVIKHDSKNHFLFTPLQSEKGKQLLRNYQLDENEMKSFVLIENNIAYSKSTAALRVTKHLNRLFPLLYGFIIVPPFIRNAVYDLIAKNRYKWFGKKDTCMIPTEEMKRKFIF
jgi:hypothetical protein